MIFHRCTLDDLPLLREISETTYRDTFAAHNTKEDMDAYTASAFSDSALGSALQNSSSLFFFAKDKEDVVGYIKLNHAHGSTRYKWASVQRR